MRKDDFSLEELAAQHTAELPGRHLLGSLSLGLGLLGTDIIVTVGTYRDEVFAGLIVD
jgi:hypothetical protein